MTALTDAQDAAAAYRTAYALVDAADVLPGLTALDTMAAQMIAATTEDIVRVAWRALRVAKMQINAIEASARPAVLAAVDVEIARALLNIPANPAPEPGGEG